MSTVSGFDPLADSLREVAPERIRRVGVAADGGGTPSRAMRLIRRAAGIITKSREHGSGAVRPVCPFVESRYDGAMKRLAAGMMRSPDCLTLLMAAENQYVPSLVNAPATVRNRLILVMHQPPSWLRLHWRDWQAVDGVRAIICLSQEQEHFLRGMTDAVVLRIYHGVRHDFFVPFGGQRSRREPRLLFVGQWLRDFATLRASMQRIWAAEPGVTLDCVVPWDKRGSADLLSLAQDRRVGWHADTDADQLRSLYQRADLLFAPVLDATANNAVVEALACGLPVVSTNVGGMPDYVGPEIGELCTPGDPEAHADAVIRWLRDPALRATAGVAARHFAKKSLDWHTVAKALLTAIDAT